MDKIVKSSNKLSQKAEVFFILIIIFFLIIISIAVIFGGILTNETITQKSKIESVKVDALILSAINDSVYRLKQNPLLTLSTTTLNLSQGSVDYSISKVNPTESKINIKAISGKVIKNSFAQIFFSTSSSAGTITQIKFNYQ